MTTYTVDLTDPGGGIGGFVRDIATGVGNGLWYTGPGLIGDLAAIIPGGQGISDAIHQAHDDLEIWGGANEDSWAYRGGTAVGFVAGTVASGGTGAVARGGARAAAGGEAALSSIAERIAVVAETRIGEPLTAKTAALACSFSGETLVQMADGAHKPIQELLVGDLVVSTDPETGFVGPRPIVQVIVHEDLLQALEVDGSILDTTKTHPFWSVTDARFEPASDLSRGEILLRSNGSWAVVTSAMDEVGSVGLAYNLAIEGVHTFHVGDAGLLVHNTCPINPSKYVRELDGGVVRSYKKFTPARQDGEIAGARYVRETGPRGSRGWMEAYDHNGRVRIVHPKSGDFKHYRFGPDGDYLGTLE